MKRTAHSLAAIALVVLSACSKQDVAESPKFDPKVIAAEADKGNLGPLTELNAACSAEVDKNGKRLGACKVQDDVRELRKPLNIRF